MGNIATWIADEVPPPHRSDTVYAVSATRPVSPAAFPSPKSAGALHVTRKRVASLTPGAGEKADICVMVTCAGALGGPRVVGGGVVVVLNRANVEVELS